MNKDFEKLDKYIEIIEDSKSSITNRLKAHKNACIRISNIKKEFNKYIDKLKNNNNIEIEKDIDFDDINEQVNIYMKDINDLNLDKAITKYISLSNKLNSGLKNFSKVKMEINKATESMDKIKIQSINDLFNDNKNNEIESKEDSDSNDEDLYSDSDTDDD